MTVEDQQIITAFPAVSDRKLVFEYNAEIGQFYISVQGIQFSIEAASFWQQFPTFKHAANAVHISYRELLDVFYVTRKYDDMPIEYDYSRVCIEWDWIQENLSELKKFGFEFTLPQVKPNFYGAAIRAQENLNRTDYYITRHTEELAAGDSTTLTQEQFQAIRAYRLELRNVIKEEKALGRELHVSEITLPELPEILVGKDLITTEIVRREITEYEEYIQNSQNPSA